MIKSKIWNALEKQAHLISTCALNDLYQQSPSRDTEFKKEACGIELDFSKQRVTNDTLGLLFNLAEACELKEKINALMSGEKVNTSEDRAALHTTLRVPNYKPFMLDGRDIMLDVFEARHKMEVIAEDVRNQTWFGYSNQSITDVVNIGMGGSDLGVKLCLEALHDDTSSTLCFHFISDADPDGFKRTVATLNPEKTLFIVSSKSFTTKETLLNMKQAMDWVGSSYRFDQHFIAVTAHAEKAHALGINNTLPIWEWVGGRYSACSAVNLMTMIAIGPDQFKEFLSGAHAMDMHFKNTPFEANLPVLTALLGIWNNNFMGIHTLLMLVYSNRLEQLVPYVQQLDMESNGKRIDRDNKVVPYATGPIVWGGHGNRAQHSYYQLLCQGTHRVTIDFISLKAFDECMVNAFCRAKQRVLVNGVQTGDEVSKQILGETPLSHFRLAQCSPYVLGALISLYEHKIYTQGVIWNINSFDQPGVESAKQNEGEVIEFV
ncbi:MAG: glucose-6-phosphate isomerase [Legionellaceae bacterium]|nr:glucose-6-phosphate isomerase [Legionellaceae bacterium]